MNKGMRLMLMVVLCLVVVAAGVVVGCGKSKEKTLQKVDITLSQYLKGATGDFDDATINTAAEGAGEGGANTMFMAFTPSTAGLPKGTKYENLTPAQKDAVQATAAAYFDSVQAAIDDGTPLTDNPAYVTLHELTGMTWFGLWADPFVGFSPVDAFWKVWPDPVGRGAKVEYLDAKAEAAYGTPTDDPVKIGYAQITDAQRAALDADLATFLATMQTQVAAANAASTAAATAVISLPAHQDAFTAAFTAGVAAGAIGSPAFTAAFTLELQTHWPADYAAMVGAATVALMTAAKATDAFVVLKGVNLAAAEGWKTDVTAGVHPVQAFKRWMVKPSLLSLAGLGLLIQLSVAEFDLKITNPNDYDVSIDTIDFNVSCNANGFGYYPARDVDAAKMALHDAVWVPANGSIDLHMIVPMKTMDILTWLIVGPGLDSTTAGTYAADVWSRMKAGTAVWNVTAVTSQTSPKGQNIPDATYTMTWTPATS